MINGVQGVRVAGVEECFRYESLPNPKRLEDDLCLFDPLAMEVTLKTALEKETRWFLPRLIRVAVRVAVGL